MTASAFCRRHTVIVLACLIGWAACAPCIPADDGNSAPSGLPAAAAPVAELGGDGVTAFRHEHTLWLVLDRTAGERTSTDIPRLNAPIRSLQWMNHADHPLEFVPEPRHWRISWKSVPAPQPVIEVQFDAPPVPASEPPVVRSTGDGSVLLPAHLAETHGEKLRFEPQPHKNTVGYWTVPTDYVDWQLHVEQPGVFVVTVLQGCGAGQGGSDALLTLRQDDQIRAQLAFQTVDTGHFQNFRWVEAGTIQVSEAGCYELRIEPQCIAKAALFDVRAVHLVRQAKSDDGKRPRD